MPSDSLLMGVDVGTTNIKAIVFDLRGHVMAQASVPTPTHYPEPGRAYYDPQELWQKTAQTLHLATDQLREPAQIVGVAVASIGETGVPLDQQGRPTYEAIAWFDNRTKPQAQWLDEVIGQDALFATTGLALRPIFSLCKLIWLRENEPEAYVRTVLWLNTADYIAYRLCDVPATDYSLASRTLALDLHRLQWAEDLLEAIGVSPHLFAPLLPGGSPLGTVTEEAAEATGLPTSAHVATGGHDHVVGAFAVGVNQAGTMLNSLGTAEALFLPLDRPLTDPVVGRQGYTQGAYMAGQYYVFGGQYTTGASIDWFRSTVAGGADYAVLIAEAEKAPPGSRGVQFLPHLRLANPPYHDPQASGAFLGLTADVDRGMLFRAVLEGLAYESRNTLEPLLRYSNQEHLKTILAIGGGTRNRLFMDIKATVFNHAMTVAGVEEATALGAALLGGMGAGVYSNATMALQDLDYSQTTVEPITEQVELYDRYFRQVYQQIYPTLRSLNHAISSLRS